MLMKKRTILGLVVGISLALTACGSTGSSKNDSAMYAESSVATTESYAGNDYAYEDYEYAEEEYDDEGIVTSTADGGDVSVSENANTSNRKLIKTVNLNVETKSFDELVTGLTEEINSLGGYIEDMNGNYGSVYSSYRSSKSANITARIPKEKLDGFVNKVGESANITSKSESVRDVTLDYVDMESHKKMLIEEQDRLMEFLEQAETIEEIISIEDRLTEIRYQVDSMESQLRTYDNKVDYSTVTIYIQEVVDYTTPIEEPKTPTERMKEGFANSVRDIGIGLREFGIGFVINLPYIVLLLILAVIAFVIYRIVNRKLKAKEEKRKLEKQKAREEAIARGETVPEQKVFVEKPKN